MSRTFYLTRKEAVSHKNLCDNKIGFSEISGPGAIPPIAVMAVDYDVTNDTYPLGAGITLYKCD